MDGKEATLAILVAGSLLVIVFFDSPVAGGEAATERAARVLEHS